MFNSRIVEELHVPKEFKRIYDIAYNLRWSWDRDSQILFSQINADSWAMYHNPVEVLINTDHEKWKALSGNDTFISLYGKVLNDLDNYLAKSNNLESPTVAYFSMEYGLHHSLALYSGGLGVLAGDHLKSASDLGIPIIGIGLLYRNGYFHQTIDQFGRQQHHYPYYDFYRLPLKVIVDQYGKDLYIEVPVGEESVKVRLWLAEVGRVKLILLDTDVPENPSHLRPITNILYIDNREMRFVQEMVIGIGGFKALDLIGIDVDCFHINESHCALLQLARIATLDGEIKDRIANVASNTVFTTHTPVPAGNETFGSDIVGKYLGPWLKQNSLDFTEIQNLASYKDDKWNWNLTALAIRTSEFVNGVSKVHAHTSNVIWRELLEETKKTIFPITNGVHLKTWVGESVDTLLNEHVGLNWPEVVLRSKAELLLAKIDLKSIWQAHIVQKRNLLAFIKRRLVRQIARHGSSPFDLKAVEELLDEKAMLIGFARRFASYKRAGLIFHDKSRLLTILNDPERPVKLIFAGKAHPADMEGQQLVQDIFSLSRSKEFLGKIFFIEDYDMRVAKMLVQGVDLWLNTPKAPLEASGTSGQKAAANAIPNLSVADGWWVEGYNGKNGWIFSVDRREEENKDEKDAEELYDILENEVIPLYFRRDDENFPKEWVKIMRWSLISSLTYFSSDRMVKEYYHKCYLPGVKKRDNKRLKYSLAK